MPKEDFEEQKSISDRKYEEMVKRVKEVADYTIETGASTRQVAKFFTDNKYKISNATVCSYLSQRLPRIDPARYVLVKPIIDKNTPKTVETVEVRKRIYSATSLLLRGLTIPQIVEELNIGRLENEQVTFDIIYDDLTKRLQQIEKDSAILEDVKKRLRENRLDTLNNQGLNGPNMSALTQPRLKGKFATPEQIEEAKRTM